MGSRFFSSLALVVFLAAAHAADTAEEVFKKASSALLSQDYVSAERGFQQVLQLEPKNIGALGNLGVIYSRTHRYGDAVRTYKKALQILPNEKTLLTNLGIAYVKQEQFSLALPIFTILSKDASNVQARELLASCYLSLGQYDQALPILTSLRSTDNNPGILYMTGVVLTRLKRTDEAHQAFLEMMNKVSPAQANFLMGKASYETEDFAQAEKFLRMAAEADPTLDGVHRELGKTLVSLRKDDEAIQELRMAAPGDAEASYFLGAALSHSQTSEATALLKRAEQLTPDFWGPPYYLGRIALDAGRVDESIRLLLRAAQLKPSESAVHYQLGRAYQVAGKQAESKAEFARVKELKEQALKREVQAVDSKPK